MSDKLIILFTFLLFGFSYKAQECDTTVYDVVEEMPEFPGGIEEMYKYITNVSLPKLDTNERLIASFHFVLSIDCLGNITKVEALKFPEHPYTLAIKNHISTMPNWIPGKLNGEFVNVKYGLPLHITIDIN